MKKQPNNYQILRVTARNLLALSGIQWLALAVVAASAGMLETMLILYGLFIVCMFLSIHLHQKKDNGKESP